MAITKSNRKSARKSQAQAAKTENDDTSDVENVEETTATSKLEKSFKKKDTKKSKDVKKKNKKQEDDEDSDNEDQDASINGAEKNKQKTSDTLKTDEVEGSDEEEESDDESEEEAKNAKANKTSKKNNSTGKEGESSEEDDYSSENGESEEDESNKGPGETRSSFKADRNSLIVGNLPYSATNNMLQELLQTVITKKEIKDCNIAAYNNGKTKGYAYVEVTSKEAVEKVLQLNGSKMDCRKLLVAVNDRRIDKIFAQVKNTLHIGYISKAATDGQIIEFLEKVIPINEIVRFERVKTFRGEPMGYLILEVASEEAAEQIKKLHEVVLDGQAITVNEYRTSVVNPNFLTTIHQNLNKGSHFKKNFSNNRRSGNRGSTDGYNKNTNQTKFFKKRAFSDRSDGTQKQQKSKKPRK